MPRLTALLSESVAYTRRLLVLAVVPFVTALLRWNDVTAAAAARGRYGVSFGGPIPVVDLWTFVNAPTDELAGGVSAGSGPILPAWSVFAVAGGTVLFAAISGLLLAGFLGSIHEGVVRSDGTFAFLQNARRFARPMIVYEFLKYGTLLAIVGLLFVLPLPALLGLLAVSVLAYLFYPTPYLVVVADEPLDGALRRSYALTTGDAGVAPLGFFAAYVGLSAAISLPLSTVTLNSGLVGVVVAAGVAAPIGLVLTIFAYLFVTSIVDADPSEPPATHRA